jgi:hypothetical protein
MDAIDLVTDQSKVIDERSWMTEPSENGQLTGQKKSCLPNTQVDVRERIPLMRIQDQSTQH